MHNHYSLTMSFPPDLLCCAHSNNIKFKRSSGGNALCRSVLKSHQIGAQICCRTQQGVAKSGASHKRSQPQKACPNDRAPATRTLYQANCQTKKRLMRSLTHLALSVKSRRQRDVEATHESNHKVNQSSCPPRPRELVPHEDSYDRVAGANARRKQTIYVCMCV